MSSADDHQPDAPPPSAPPADVSPFAPTSPFVEYLQPPRLGIIHLLAWTAAMAVLMKFGQGMKMLQADAVSSLGPAYETMQSIMQSAYAAVGAAGFVGAAILLMTKIRRTPGNFQPGHWILLVNAPVMLMYYLSFMLLAVWGRLEDRPVDFAWHLGTIALLSLLHAGGYIVAIWKARAPRRWKAYFLLLVLVLLLQSLIYLVVALTDRSILLSWGWSMVWSAIGGISLLTVVLFDLLKRTRRDWVHWTGVAVVAASVLLEVGWWVAMKFIEPQLSISQ